MSSITSPLLKSFQTICLGGAERKRGWRRECRPFTGLIFWTLNEPLFHDLSVKDFSKRKTRIVIWKLLDILLLRDSGFENFPLSPSLLLSSWIFTPDVNFKIPCYFWKNDVFQMLIIIQALIIDSWYVYILRLQESDLRSFKSFISAVCLR